MKIRTNLNSIIKSELVEYPTPMNLNYFWGFGSLAGLFLVLQIITGILLAMQYTPHADLAFDSVERVMRDINFGWLFRYMHANGASFFFFVVYMHMFRGLWYSSYLYPRHHIWLSGVLIYLLMMATAFLGYVFPWGQMSFWGATVITNIITSLPFGDGGESFAIWLWGGYSVDNPTLNRFFSLHFFLPFAIAGLVIVHLYLLHLQGSSDPLLRAKKMDYVPFYSYFYQKDLLGFLIIFSILVFFITYFPNLLGHSDNYIPANALVTPKHIVPEWYFLPFYGILRAIPNKFGGIAAMFSAIILLALIPFIASPHSFTGSTYLTSGLYSRFGNIMYKRLVALFSGNFVLLAWIGGATVTPNIAIVGIYSAFAYFIFFLAVWVLYSFESYNFRLFPWLSKVI